MNLLETSTFIIHPDWVFIPPLNILSMLLYFHMIFFSLTIIVWHIAIFIFLLISYYAFQVIQKEKVKELNLHEVSTFHIFLDTSIKRHLLFLSCDKNFILFIYLSSAWLVHTLDHILLTSNNSSNHIVLLRFATPVREYRSETAMNPVWWCSCCTVSVCLFR